MNKIAERKAAAKVLEKEKSRAKYAKYALYAVGAVGVGYATKQYHDVFINMWLLIFTDIIIGFLLALIVEKNYKNWSWATVCFGGLVVGPLVLANNLASAPSQTYKLPVKEVYVPATHKYSAYVVIHYADMDKNVIFDDSVREQLHGTKYISITVQKGNLGYYIIRDRKLAK